MYIFFIKYLFNLRV